MLDIFFYRVFRLLEKRTVQGHFTQSLCHDRSTAFPTAGWGWGTPSLYDGVTSMSGICLSQAAYTEILLLNEKVWLKK